MAEAEQAVSEVLKANKFVIQRWASAPVGRPLRLSIKMARDFGEGVVNPAKSTVAPGAVQGLLPIKTVTVISKQDDASRADLVRDGVPGRHA